MKMKRYFAPDARQALRALRDEQGPEAVILSNRRINGGVEIIAAMDYEDSMVNASLGNPDALSEIDPYQNTLREQQAAQTSSAGTQKPAPAKQENLKTADLINNKISASQPNAGSATLNKIQDELAGLRNIMEAPMMQFSWGETGRVQPLYANLLKQLMTLGISSGLSQIIAKKLEKQGLSKHSWLESLNHLASLVPIDDRDILSSGGIISLVGPTGVGKTTTIAKLAARFALKHGRRAVTLITTDNYRIGAHEQLRSYGRILGIPVHVASDSEELKYLLQEIKDKHGDNQLTLIDTAGICQKEVKLTEQITSLDVDGIDIKNYLVLSATGQMNLQDDVITGFGKINLSGCIITKIDETASLGEIISVLIKHELPVSFVCDGQKVPDDLHRARGRLLVKEAVKLMRSLNKSLSDEELAYTFGRALNDGNV
jgi:flagellar biosynthesis protein FlhF